ncbi:MAG: transglycosylase domain-containing protein [Bacteroidetes bacterium]|uniref:Transglycosylase domain-containing protein n=2 Tax=Candidatus Merdivivens TaxID=2840533 RepID=A0A9D9N9W4_9BACT|nr:transglycosylase domain-containing protein [Candidatus Merdivivens pullistercoris]MBO8481901.1 transglycosylase domain-containing protein [Candidatus Merdivivens faecigallinarum]
MKEKTKKNIVKWWWIVVCSCVGIVLLLLAGVGLFAEIPSFEELENPESKAATLLLAEDGEVLSTYHIENRSYVTYEELSPNVVNAAVATEDVRFYKHSGIDFRSLARVGVKTLLLGQSSQGGGSTITQQLAKTLYPREELGKRIPVVWQLKMIVTKLKEWITAVKLERNYTKEEIMDMYMNAVFFGSNAYGIRAASHTFFDKEPADLTVEEAATLVGMVNKPTRYNPALNPEASLQRRNFVIGQMAKAGYITDSERDSICRIPITLSYQVQDHNSGIAPYFRDMLRRVMSASEPDRSDYSIYEDYAADSLAWADDPLYGWLNKNLKPDGSKYDLDRDGLRIYTTINYKMQKFAEEAVAEHLGKDLQKAFFRDLGRKRNAPFSNDIDSKTVDRVMKQARRWSDRYRNMKNSGASEAEILKSFDTPQKMRVFSWNKGGHIDTVMTPNDSIRYYKSILRAAFIAMEPNSGEIKAYVGGPNYRYFKYDHARQGKRQVGSTIKPFLYTLAMQEGMSPCDKVVNVPQTFIIGDKTWTPKSTDRDEWIGRTVTLKWGLTKSSNNISAYLMKRFGPEAMVEMCHKMGIQSFLDPVPSLCAGPADLSLYEMVGAYNTFPSRGVHIDPIFVTRIEDNMGNVLGEFNARKREAISEQTAYLMVNLMQGVVNDGTAMRLRWKYGIKGELAGKTGTTNDQADGWFIGYTPSITAGIWVGAEDRQVHFESLALGGGSNMALPIWGIFMNKILEDGTLPISEHDRFIAPAGMVLDLDCDGSDADAASSSGGGDDSFFD